ncbi:AmmeMemoRadiSam system protein A [Orenia marismortui]|uniref:AmmeMemoRadiSam system protein A n=1 Tax=Orenia marismortui TaxID=46469 RepID=UPI00035E53A4|nr:AmmeMemoRadiSam system protein A [Orenia marismortui]
MNGVVFAALSPHPPVLIPEIGTEELAYINKTKSSMQKVANQIKKIDPDMIVTISPHGPVFSDAISILSSKELIGDFANFGRSDIKLKYELEEKFTSKLAVAANSQDIVTARIDKATARKLEVKMELDHGVLVPMYYLEKAGIHKPLVPITIGMLSYEELYTFGKIIQLVAENLDYKVAIIASGDLSHRLTSDAPGGFNPKGEVFDNKLVKNLDNMEFEKIFDLDKSLITQAGECGLRPIMIMLGALDRLDVDGGVLSYEGPFGVGYAVANYQITGKTDEEGLLDKINKKRKEKLLEVRENESEVVKLARQAVEEYIKNRNIIDPPSKIDPELADRAGVFVSIYKNGNLRGCIGTTNPTQANISREIIKNSLSAAFEDPRFEPVNLNEIDELTYSVDILGEAEIIENIESLNPNKYGVIVRKGERAGLLLPNLEGVDNVKKQVEIAKRKAGISKEDNDIELMRFTVTRYN